MKQLNPFKYLALVLSFVIIQKNNAQNLVVDGSFTGGGSFVTTLVSCNTANCLFPFVNNAYAIGTNPNFYHSAFFGADHTTGTGNMMIVNGGLNADIVWQQNVPVAAGNTYSFSIWACSVYTANPAMLELSINGVVQGTLPLPSTTGTWLPFSVAWSSLTVSSAIITVRVTNTSVPLSQNGVDFGIDDIALQRLCVCPQDPRNPDK